MRNQANQFLVSLGFSTLLAVAALLWPADLAAQAPLPAAEHIAARLADHETRQETLLAMASLARLRQRLEGSGAAGSTDGLRQDRAWLDRLITRFGTPRPRAPVLDPAAWLVHLQLHQHQLQPSRLVSPAGPGLGIYLGQVFDRSNERLSFAVLPQLLWQLEPVATLTWSELLTLAADDEALRASLADVSSEWFPGWQDAGDPAPSGADIDQAAASLGVLAVSVLASGPPDRARLERDRLALMAAMPGLDAGARAEAAAFLRIAGLLDGLHEQRYFAFAEGLLAVVAELLAGAGQAEHGPSAAAAWLSSELPGISSAHARAFASVDPRLNSALAAALDVVRSLVRADGEAREAGVLQRELADSVAQLALLIPDLDYYFELPIRDPVAGGIDACAGMMARRDAEDKPAMTRELFNDCQQTLVRLADEEARAAGLAGDPDGPFGLAQLQRELSVTSGQRINYGIGYLHDRYSTGCREPDRPLPNPLEWSALATLMTWFAEQSPVYFQTPENEARLQRMRAIGVELTDTVTEQVDCFAGAGSGLNDPVSRSLEEYRAQLATLLRDVDDALAGVRQRLLAPGADIALEKDAAQTTAYRPVGLEIGPCNPDRVCEMTATLSSTRALLGLFSDTYLVADQSGFGQIEICYDNVEWVRRRSAPVREGDTNVANYFGHLSFDLRGRFRRDAELTDVFGFRFTSPNEHHYMFAAASEEVLADSCPMEWVGTKIVTPLRDRAAGIVPNRLTYLAAPRMLPSRLLAQNWDKGAEWRDWFITGIGVEPLENEAPQDIGQAVTQHLQSLYRAEQSAVYDSLLQPATRAPAAGLNSRVQDVTRLTTTKALIRMQMMLFYPQLLMDSDALRTAVAGQGGLLDNRVLGRMRDGNVPVASIGTHALERFEQFRSTWRSQAELTLRTGAVAGSQAHAMMRLNSVHAEFFAPRPPGPAEITLTPPVAGDDG